MTEAEWLACDDPIQLLRHLQPDENGRKRLLLTSTCLRRSWETLPQAGREWVECAEQAADHRISLEALSALQEDCEQAIADRWGTGKGIEAIDAVKELFYARYWFDDYIYLIGDAAWKAERREQVVILRDIFGNPFRPVNVTPTWLTSTVVALARQMYESRDFTPMPILADALQDAGCDHPDILDHCRGPGPHVRGCWVIDLVLGKT
jgi:hypothetical protein